MFRFKLLSYSKNYRHRHVVYCSALIGARSAVNMRDSADNERAQKVVTVIIFLNFE